MTKMPGYPCDVCCRASESIVINLPNQPIRQFCSHECAVIFMTKKPVKPDERTAAKIGGNAGGAYLDGIGKTDLASLTEDEWTEFCVRVFQGTCEELKRRANDEIPF